MVLVSLRLVMTSSSSSYLDGSLGPSLSSLDSRLNGPALYGSTGLPPVRVQVQQFRVHKESPVKENHKKMNINGVSKAHFLNVSELEEIV